MKKYFSKSFVLFIFLFFVLFGFKSVYANTPPPPPEFSETDIPIGGVTTAEEGIESLENVIPFGQSNQNVLLNTSEGNPMRDINGEHISATPSINVHLKVGKGDTILYDNLNMSVTPCDTSSNGEVLTTARCALLQSGLDINWIYGGAYVDSINGIAGYVSQDNLGNNVYHYWSVYFNNNYAEVGLNQYVLQPGDIVTLDFVDPVDINTGCTNCDGDNSKIFDIDKAINFLKSHQGADGSFVSDLYTDWVAIASASVGDSSLKTNLKNYLLNNDFNSSLVTDNERHAMSLMSLGVNPYSGTGVNYIKKITDSFDGEQVGDSDLVNDDVFGLIVLKNAGYSSSDEIITKIISFVISNQSANGSFGSVDMTGAGIQALKNFESVDGVSVAIEKAKDYLVSVQGGDGGFYDSFSNTSNSSSTSWALQALSTDSTLDTNIEKAENYLASKQQDDGGLDTFDDISNRIWATAYALPAISHKTWNEIMENFSKVTDPIYPNSHDDKEKIVEETKVVEEPKIELRESDIENQKIIPLVNAENLKEEKVMTEDIVGNLSASAGDAVGDKKLPRWSIQVAIGLIGISIFGFIFRLKI